MTTTINYSDRNSLWELTFPAISSLDEEIIFALHYYSALQNEPIEYTFYVIKNGEEYYIKYFDVLLLEEYAAECSTALIDNIKANQEVSFGILTNRYKSYLINEMAYKTHSLDKEELKQKLLAIDNCISGEVDLKMCFCDTPSVSIDVIDFFNGIQFYSDNIVSQKYSAIIDFVDYIFSKVNIQNLTKCELEMVK